MVRTLERPGEGHAMRSMRLEELEGVMEHCRNALKRAEDEGDLRVARVFARQQDRAAAELLARRLERQQRDQEHTENMATKERLDEMYNVEREAMQFRMMLQDGLITEDEYEAALERLEDET